MLPIEDGGITPEEQALLDRELNRLKEACGKLHEHFDTVQIFCTSQAEDNKTTNKFQYGTGNGFAIYGQVKSYVLSTEESFKEEGYKSVEEEDGDDIGKL